MNDDNFNNQNPNQNNDGNNGNQNRESNNANRQSDSLNQENENSYRDEQNQRNLNTERQNNSSNQDNQTNDRRDDVSRNNDQFGNHQNSGHQSSDHQNDRGNYDNSNHNFPNERNSNRDFQNNNNNDNQNSRNPQDDQFREEQSRRNQNSNPQNERPNYEDQNRNNLNRGDYNQNNHNNNNQNNQNYSDRDYQNQGNNSHQNVNPNANNYENQNDYNRGNMGANDIPNNRNTQNNGGNFDNGNGGNTGNGNGGNIGGDHKNNNNRNIIIAVIATLFLAIAAYFLFFNKKDKEVVSNSEMGIKDTSEVGAAIVDTTNSAMNTERNTDEYGEEEEYVTESYVIANEAYLRSTPSSDAASMVKSMKFGDKIYVKNSENINGYSTVYLSKPANEKNITEQPYYLLESTAVSQYQYEEFKEYFSIKPFSGLGSKTKKLIIEKAYNDGVDYKVTQNVDRAKNCLSYGDYDKDGVMDVAIVLDNNEKQVSRLLIICTNKATKDPYLAYAENYSDKIKVNTFKKGASVFMNTDDFTPSPNDGVIVQGEDVKIAIIYDAGNQKFKTYYQE
ncbi:hypothetical protein [Frigoriflavimonas asaccharolytica]|uniref:Preprotein translocase subunit SecG n=1 Tax=Frigoriflavimonas asaccharolytica TaxID=2735899 RepID=A0A8J8GA04_9FLAO|nr:hypothetical protein [Frigoriflavimonas asaccharolytica]NRS94001.1 preprotein translocase subunit SecG [Frigoriflavimonas asaccharolytica]